MSIEEVYRKYGRNEHSLDVQREVLKFFLSERFGKLSKKVVKKIEAETDPGLLVRWLMRTKRAHTLEDVGIF